MGAQAQKAQESLKFLLFRLFFLLSFSDRGPLIGRDDNEATISAAKRL